MLGLSVTINSERATKTLDGLAAPIKKITLKAVGARMVVAAKENIQARRGPTGAAWPTGPWTELFAGARIWGDIAKTLVTVIPPLAEPTVVVGATHLAAGVRHLGTRGAGGELPDIVPKKKKALTIPLTDAASRASYYGQDARSAFPDSFLLDKKGTHGASPLTLGVVARKVGKKNPKLELLYLLTARVAIRPHPFLPVDKDGKLAPTSLGQEVDELILNSVIDGDGRAVA